MIKPTNVDDPRHFKVKGVHSHAPDARKLQKKKVTTKMKELAKTTSMTSRQIVYESMDNVSDATAAVMPSTTQLIQTVNRTRKDPDAPKNPTKLSELRFPARFGDFILHDTYNAEDEDSNDRLIIFGTQANLDFMVRCDGLFMDGTFGIVPRLFYQLYTIHGKTI